MYTKRECAMKWWNNLSSLRKTQICDTNTELVGGIRRWETLTGGEIESLFDEEVSRRTDDVFNENKNKGTQKSPFGMWS